MPHTLAALTAGAISEWRATLVAKETAWLPVDGRRHVDELLAPRLTGAGDRAVAAHARALAQAWDPAEAVAHLRRAETHRRVSIRPAPDTMVHLSALLPMVHGVAAHAALDKATAAAIATGDADGRGRGQLMADLLVQRLTGQHTADAVPVEIHLVPLRRLLILRDDTCRTPWCDAPIRHADHTTPHRTGGATSYTNGSGLCEHCNHTKEADHWAYRASPDGLDVVTPTGHRYRAPTRALLPAGVGNPRPPTSRAPARRGRSARFGVPTWARGRRRRAGTRSRARTRRRAARGR